MKKWIGITMIVVGCIFSILGIFSLFLLPVMLLFNDTGQSFAQLLGEDFKIFYTIPGALLVISGAKIIDKSR